jgi:hypothetical protein
MKPYTSQDNVLNAAILFAAWLIVIVACVSPELEKTNTVVQIAYAAE